MITVDSKTPVTITGPDWAVMIRPDRRKIVTDGVSNLLLQQTFDAKAPVTIDEHAKLITAPEGWKLEVFES